MPAHINVLHVEQEIAGDETIALQSVLDADIKRLILSSSFLILIITCQV